MAVLICEVGPRDGLQSLGRPFEPAERVVLIDRLAAAGLPRIEAVSFVHPKRVPQMAGAEEVLARIRRPAGLEIAGLVLNARGVERALASALDEVRFVVVASESLSRRNQCASIEESLAAFAAIAEGVRAAGRRLAAVIGAAFGCPFEGRVPAHRIVALVERLLVAGAEEIVLADTIGAAVPSEVRGLVRTLRPSLGPIPLGCHLHNSRGLGMANALAALDAGVELLDASIGGLGGCPFAPGAAGNIATEDLAFMLRGMGLDQGVDLDALIGVVEWLQERLGAPLPGQLARAGPFPEVALRRAVS